MIIHSALVAIGGFFGAMARFSIGIWFKNRYSSSLPIGTLFVNLLGAFLLGFMLGKDLYQSWQLLLGTGFMGAFTTFSTFKLENVQFHFSNNRKTLLIYLGITYIFGILFAFIGMKIGGM